MSSTSVATEPFDLYCEDSLNPAFSHIWVLGFESVAVTIAMYCIIQFYIQLKNDIAPQKPLLKLAAIKLVVFLTFWQTILITLLTSTGIITPGPRFGDPDIRVGIPSMLLCIEMALFAIFHLWAFSWRPYRVNSKHTLAEIVPGYSVTETDYKGGFLGIKALLEAANPWDVLKAVGRSARWLFVGRRRRTLDSSYNRARQSTDASATLGLNPITMQHETSYKPSKNGVPGDEDQELLTHAQSNPGGPPPAYNFGNDSSYDHHLDPSDIGVAQSTFGDDESDLRSFDGRSYDDRSRGHSPIPHPPPAGGGSDRLAMPMPSVQGFRRPSPSPNRDDVEKYAEAYGEARHEPRAQSRQPRRTGKADSRPDAFAAMAVPYPESGSNTQNQTRVSMPYPQGPNSVDR